MQQTICREFKNCYNNSLLQNTNNVRNIIYSFIVTIFVILNNPQITKARSENFKSEITKFFGLSMSVEISEAIVSCFHFVVIIIFLIHLSKDKK